MKCLKVTILLISILSVLACKNASEPTATKSQNSGTEQTAVQSKTASCANVFTNLVKLCKAHPQCAPTVADIQTHRASFLKDCAQGADPQGLACAAQAQSMEAFTQCSERKKTQKPKPLAQ